MLKIKIILTSTQKYFWRGSFLQCNVTTQTGILISGPCLKHYISCLHRVNSSSVVFANGAFTKEHWFICNFFPQGEADVHRIPTYPHSKNLEMNALIECYSTQDVCHFYCIKKTLQTKGVDYFIVNTVLIEKTSECCNFCIEKLSRETLNPIVV